MPVRRSLLARILLAALVMLVAACSQRGATLSGPPDTAAGPAAVGALPDGCARDAPAPNSAPVAFVAAGRAWAASADGRRLWCLFEVRRPGPFLWGPRGDRVVLDGLEVRGVGARVFRPGQGIQPVSLTWLGPTGSALAFVSPGGLNLELASLGSVDQHELTPLRGASYGAVAAHPSGRALAFAVQREGLAEVWIASNTGGGEVQIAGEEARFGPLAFSAGGKALYFGSKLGDGTRRVDVYSLTSAEQLAPAWTGKRDVLAIVPRRDQAGTQLAVDTGSGCQDRRADLSGLDGGPGRALLPSSAQPTSAVGWLDNRRVLVAEGSCEGPFDLWVVDIGGGRQPAIIARGIDRAAVRRPDPRPAPQAPDLAALAAAGA